MNPTNRETITVHKEGEEGVILVDRDTGQVTGPAVDERPEWADGLAVAQLQERVSFYERKLGPGAKAMDSIKAATAIAYQDLAWVGADKETGGDAELSADHEYRQDIVAKALGINREDFETQALFGNTIAEVEIAADRLRGKDDATLLNEEMARTFAQTEEAAAAAEQKVATG